MNQPNDGKPLIEVPRSESTDPLTDGFDSGAWRSVAPITLDHYMGAAPCHRPTTEIKLLYDEAWVYVFFRVHDRHVVARASDHQDMVCVDSCVEWFFTPGPDLDDGYFNIETNCGGTMLLHHQQARNTDERIIPRETIDTMDIHHSLPRRVTPEIAEPVIWTVSYRVPISDLSRVAEVTRPGPGVVWRGNFYKCADESSHPHWLTWAPIDLPEPDFHQKGFFGTIRFE